MKLDIQTPTDKQIHTYCLRCRAESVTHNPQALDRKVYACTSCNHRDTRALIIDPGVKWWVDVSNEYCHETAGIFLKDQAGNFLFFERVKHPFGLTVPAGHVDVGELPRKAVLRETREETGIVPRLLAHIATHDIWGDECRRGADMHKWHIFMGHMPAGAHPVIDATEGLNPIWLTLAEAKQRPLTPAVRYIIQHCGHSLA